MRAVMHPAAFTRVRVPTYLQRSLQLALAATHAPFFAVREHDAVAVTLPDVEWTRLAERFPAATIERGLRLISLNGPPSDPAVARQLAATLAAADIPAATLPAFHRDHFVVPVECAQRCLEAVRRLIAAL